MSDWHIAAPQWVHLLWVVAAYVAALVWLEQRHGNDLERFASINLRARLVSGPSAGQRTARITLLGLTGAFLTLALMRPQWGLELVATPRAGAEIMICLDVSNSMLAEDVAPNRLERAKAEIRDLLAYLDGDQVGLIAFAGRATVLSPLTPDFGFLRLALDNASPRSVSRGGTRLEEPIRKAIAGFAGTGDVSRSILLITDGEDHDSFPLEAAKAAAVRGIRILSIGFGDEAGAEIRITDAQTKATSVLRDTEGKPVKSRLDGDMLREMALATNGAYIPAGTGVLDLQSIFEQHIAPLTRGRLDGRTRTIRNDAYQWAVLLGLICLLGSVVATGRTDLPGRTGRGSSSILPIVLVALLGAIAGSSFGTRSAEAADIAGASTQTEPANSKPADAVAQSPRMFYNEALTHLSANQLEAAQENFEQARQKADTDGEVRLRATYSLGWLAVKQADALLESAPSDALAHLERSAGWFREAVALRPGWEDARYNLELVERRITELGDSIGAKDALDLGEKLDALIDSQRDLLEALGNEVTRGRATSDPNATVKARGAYRRLSARQLAILADADTLNTQAVRELDAIKGKSEDERTPEDGLRAAQLHGVKQYVHVAREKLTQTRSRLRRLQSDAAYRRAAGGLDAMKRARDQLLDPIQRIDALLADARLLINLTRRLVAAEDTGLSASLKVETPPPSAATALGELASEPVPGWLTAAHLSEAQQRVSDRELELTNGIERALEQSASAPKGANTQPSPPQPEGGAEQEAALIERLREAVPLLEAATDASTRASTHLDSKNLKLAFREQTAAYESLLSARELFLDIRRLIELVYQAQRTLLSVLDSSRPAATQQEKNVTRMSRLGTLLSDELAKLATTPSPAGTGAPPAPGPRPNPEQQRLESAYEHWRLANRAMYDAQQYLAAFEAESSDPETLGQARDAVQTTAVHLEDLRRLFFSVLEHLKETALKQRALSDETDSLAALGGSAPPAAKAGPIAARQKQLAEAASAIAQALQEQASQPPPETTSSSPGAAGPTQAQAERFDQASGLVDEASERMDQAAEGIESGGAHFPASREHQASAQKNLAQAIALLTPPAQPDDPNDPNDPNDPDQKDGQDGSDREDEPENNTEPPPEPEQSATNSPSMRELLQEIRDREAQRRRDQAQQPHKYDPVEKNW